MSTLGPPARYQPFYCEENAWWLCAAPELGPGERHAVFVLALAGRVPMLEQREAPPGRPVAWDYHVATLDGAGRIWDLDTRLPLPCDGLHWLAASFALAQRLPPVYGPRFRVVPAAEYRQGFASDRRHMRTPTGRWRHPPPPWEPIGTGSNLDDYLDPRGPGPGRLLDLPAMAHWVAELAVGEPGPGPTVAGAG